MTGIQKKIERFLEKKNLADLLDKNGEATIKQVGDEIAGEFKEILNSQIPTPIGQKPPFEIEIRKNKIKKKDDGVCVQIFFDHKAARRKSWYPEKYPKGMDLIIAYNNGYDADGVVYKKGGEPIYSKKWGFHTPVSLSHRERSNFIQKACKLYNEKYQDIKRHVVWNEKFYDEKDE